MEKYIKILAIDDEQGMRDMLVFDLSQSGYMIVTAINGKEGIEKAKNDLFDIVITDIKMPMMNGIEVLEEIKKISPDTEVIIATGYGSMETAIEGLRRGAFDYINKPYNINELNIIINKAIERRELKETIALYEINKTIFSTIKPDELLNIIINSAIKTLKADNGFLVTFGKNKKWNISFSTDNLTTEKEKKLMISLGNRIVDLVREERDVIMLSNGYIEDVRFKDINEIGEIKSSIIFPLLLQEEILGILIVNRINKIEKFVENDIHKASIFSSLVILALKNAELYIELKEKTAQLVQKEKLTALGELAAGVTHELNQPLNAIKIISQDVVRDILKNRLDINTLKNDLTDVINQVNKMSEIINHMRIFTRRSEGVFFEKLDIRIPIEGVFKILGQQLKVHNIEIIKEYTNTEISFVYGDSIRLEQVFMNLIMNARDAFKNLNRSEGMKIWIRAYSLSGVIVPEPERNGEEEKAKVVVEIEDNGCGIPENLKEKIFEPFFTTKDPGHGTGLGLSLVNEIIKEHKGKIEVESEKGIGTKFKVILPVYEGSKT